MSVPLQDSFNGRAYPSKHHIVWGEVEELSQDSRSGSCKDSQSINNRGENAPQRNCRMSAVDVQNYFEGVMFKTDNTSSSDTSVTSNNTTPQGASRGLSSRHAQASASAEGTRRLADAALSAITSEWDDATSSRGNSHSNSGAFAASPPVGGGGPGSVDEDSDEEGLGGDESSPIRRMITAFTDANQTALIIGLRNSSLVDEEGLSAYWSAGTSLHGAGKCKPCHYVHTSSGCMNGQGCEYCHLPHSRTKPRPCKSKRLHGRRFRVFLVKVCAQDPCGFLAVVKAAASNNPQVQEILHEIETNDLDLGLPSGPDRKRNILSL